MLKGLEKGPRCLPYHLLAPGARITGQRISQHRKRISEHSFQEEPTTQCSTNPLILPGLVFRLWWTQGSLQQLQNEGGHIVFQQEGDLNKNKRFKGTVS